MSSIKKDVIKFFTKSIIFLIPFFLYIMVCIYVDIFNVFHPYKIRDITAEPNKSFLKPNYIAHNPDKFNSFIFGSSRVGFIPEAFLNDVYEDSQVWYNMTYSRGLPKEHFDNLVLFKNNNVNIKNVIIAVDDISWTLAPESHLNSLLTLPYSEYQKSKLRFYANYILQYDTLILKDVLKGKKNTNFFEPQKLPKDKAQLESYLALGADINHETSISKEVLYKQVLNDIKNIVDFCRENNINLTIITNPLWKNTYIESAQKNDYLDFLWQLANVTPYVNFSGLNAITTDGKNYYEWSHYRQYVGLLILQCLDKNITYNRNEEFLQKLKEQDFGILVTKQNVDDFIARQKNLLQTVN